MVLFNRTNKSKKKVTRRISWVETLNVKGPLTSKVVVNSQKNTRSMLQKNTRNTLLKTAKRRLKRQPFSIQVQTNRIKTSKPLGLRMGKGKGKPSSSFSLLNLGQPLIKGGPNLKRAFRPSTLGFQTKVVSSSF